MTYTEKLKFLNELVSYAKLCFRKMQDAKMITTQSYFNDVRFDGTETIYISYCCGSDDDYFDTTFSDLESEESVINFVEKVRLKKNEEMRKRAAEALAKQSELDYQQYLKLKQKYES